MARMTRLDWFDRMVRPVITKPAISVTPRTKRPKDVFRWEYDGLGGTVEAYTKSEARSILKKANDIKRKDRLPVGFKITRMR